jgi:hypothetical protein
MILILLLPYIFNDRVRICSFLYKHRSGVSVLIVTLASILNILFICLIEYERTVGIKHTLLGQLVRTYAYYTRTRWHRRNEPGKRCSIR